MIKEYTSLLHFIKDLPTLNNCIVIFPENIEEQMMFIKSNHYRSIKKAMERQHRKTIIKKEIKYENKHTQKAI